MEVSSLSFSSLTLIRALVICSVKARNSVLVWGSLHKMSRDPHTSTLFLAFTEHITNALIKVREEKLRLETSIPRKLGDGWDPMIKIKLNNFSCFALCDVGASTSVMPKRMYDMLDVKPFYL